MGMHPGWETRTRGRPSGLCAGQAAVQGPDVLSSEAGPEHVAQHTPGRSEPAPTRFYGFLEA